MVVHTADTWYGETAYGGTHTLDGTPFAFVNSDAAGSALIWMKN